MKIRYDADLTLSVGSSCWTKVWKTRQLTWSSLLRKLQTPQRTGETVAEYRKMSRTDKGRKKDVGGFVGGLLKGGRRAQSHVISRQLVCLDADKATDDFILDVDLALGGTAYTYYTTHGHTPERPRFRLIVPLEEPVTPEQYPAVARRLAADVGIDYFDPTTYGCSRLMYWPSAPEDGEYLFGYEDAPFLKGDAVLARYQDWTDAGQWPTGKTESAAHARSAKQQGDPLTKPGLIGAFNRTFYPIGKVIETYLSGVYGETGHPDRYTYLAGSTVAGLIIYDDKFAYSHHGTDPISGHLCSAFDLVRLHLFGSQDDDCREDVPVNKRPSFASMSKLAGESPDVVQELNKAELTELFEDTDDDSDLEWLKTLDRTTGKHPVILPTAKNFITILTNDRHLVNKFGRDDFSRRIAVKGDLPWRKQAEGTIWRDEDDAQLRNYLSRVYDLTGRSVIDDALTEVIARNHFHPVREYLENLTWDGTERAETLYVDYLGAKDSAYTRTVTLTHLKAAVARVLHPGIKFDACLVLSGPQGIGKSTVLSKLGGPWFNDSITSLQGKDPMEQLRGSWIIELSEMQAANKAENDMIKSFISRQVDKFRAAYGRRTEEFERQCVFTATTNDFVFLKDRSGGRRFWPILGTENAKKSALDDLPQSYIDQVWAEAYEKYRKDPRLTLPRDVTEQVKLLQKMHTEGSELEGIILDYLDKKLPDEWEGMDLYDRRTYLENYNDGDEQAGAARERVCVLEIWCEALGNRKETLKNMNAREINGVLQNLPGWEPYKNKEGKLRFGTLYGLQRAFVHEERKNRVYQTLV